MVRQPDRLRNAAQSVIRMDFMRSRIASATGELKANQRCIRSMSCSAFRAPIADNAVATAATPSRESIKTSMPRNPMSRGAWLSGTGLRSSLANKQGDANQEHSDSDQRETRPDNARQRKD